MFAPLKTSMNSSVQSRRTGDARWIRVPCAATSTTNNAKATLGNNQRTGCTTRVGSKDCKTDATTSASSTGAELSPSYVRRHAGMMSLWTRLIASTTTWLGVQRRSYHRLRTGGSGGVTTPVLLVAPLDQSNSSAAVSRMAALERSVIATN